MTVSLPLHPRRRDILYALRHSPHMRYAELMRVTDLESDVFKFHLRALVEGGLAFKSTDGSYELTSIGKEFSNNLNNETGLCYQQPKLSMILFLERNVGGEKEYLLQQRKRAPFYNYWGHISGPVKQGMSIERSACHELMKQTGLFAAPSIFGFCRVLDYLPDGETLLEDKLFAIVRMLEVQGDLREWHAGVNQWVALNRYDQLSERFTLTDKVLQAFKQNDTYFEMKNVYDSEK